MFVLFVNKNGVYDPIGQPGLLRLDIDVHLECAEISLRLFLSPCHLTGSH